MEKSYWYKDSVIYQIYPKSFKDSNSDGYGDIKGIIEKMDYIKELGINTIKLSSIFNYLPNDKNIYEIDPIFGNNDDIKELVNECHKKDIKVIMDIQALKKDELKNTLTYYISLHIDGFNLIFKNKKIYKDILPELNESIFNNTEILKMVEIEGTNKIKNEKLGFIFDYSIFKSDRRLNNQFFKKKFNIINFKNSLFKRQIKCFKKYNNALILENHNNPRCNSRFGLNYHGFWFESTTMLPIIMYFGYGTPFIYQGQEIGIINTPFTRIEELKDPISHNFYTKAKRFVKDKKAFEMVRYGARDHARTPMQWDQSFNAGFSDAIPWMMVNPTYQLINVYVDQNIDNSVYYFYKDLLHLKSDDIFINGRIKEYNHLNKNIIAYKRYDKDTVFVVGNFTDKNYKYNIPKDLKNNKYRVLFSNYQENEITGNCINLKPYEAILIEIEF